MDHNSKIDSIVIERIFAKPTYEPGEEYIDINATVQPSDEDKPEDRFVVVSTPTDDDGVLLDLGGVFSGTWTPAFARAVAAALVRAADAADASTAAFVAAARDADPDFGR